jgi:hypothetical protein
VPERIDFDTEYRRIDSNPITRHVLREPREHSECADGVQ